MSEPTHRYATVDVHTHFHPDAAAFMREVMEMNNLSHVINLGFLQHLDIPFEQGMADYRRVLGDRHVYFATPDFSDVAPGFGERMADDLERKVQAGASGLKIFKQLGLEHKDAGGKLIAIDEPRLDPLWARAGELGVPVLIHTADPVAFFQPLDENNERWEELQVHPEWHFGKAGYPGHDELLEQRNRMMERHPHTTFIGAHLGNYPEDLDYVDRCLDRYANFFVDTSARIAEIGRHPAEETRAFFIKHQDRVLFGTDVVLRQPPEEPQQQSARLRQLYDTHWRFFETGEAQIDHPSLLQGRWKVDAVDLPREVLEKLYSGNARRLIPALQT